MNWLTVTILVIILAFTINGYRQGFSGMITRVAALLIAFVFTCFAAAGVKKTVLEKTDWLDRVTEKVEQKMFSGDSEETDEETGESLEDKLTSMKLPGFMKELILSRAEEASEAAERKVHAAAVKIAELILTTATYAALFVMVWIIALVLFGLLEKVMRLPGLKQLDGITGLFLGLLEAVFVMDLFFLFATAISATTLGTSLMGQITESRILSFLYEKNVLLMILKSVL